MSRAPEPGRVVAAIVGVFALATACAAPTDGPARLGTRAAAAVAAARQAWNSDATHPYADPYASAGVPSDFNVYASTMGSEPIPALAGIPPRVYVPNAASNSVWVIDPKTFQVVDRLVTGNLPYHVTPAWDMTVLYAGNEASSTLTVIDPATSKMVRSIPVTYPYNLYFTPDGTKAVVVTERLMRVEFWDPTSWRLIKVVAIPWAGADHVDFSADGHFMYVSTEFTGRLARISVDSMELEGAVEVGGLPVDVKLSPDGRWVFVANQGRHGISVVDPVAMKEVEFIHTGLGAHGLQFSRDTRFLYVTNRLAGSVSVIDWQARRVVATWRTGGSPDMTQLNWDGTQLWVSSRFDGAVMVIDTHDGSVIKRIQAGPQAHGLTFFPNIGDHSLGHNGVYR